ncbi:MAG TPA: ATP-binding protein [Tissierellia bacterium]|jgi:hypothetical protein|nr:ATP-binding protein [Tissierellia bacterium]
MVKILAGGKGSGKTKRMIEMANEAARDPHGTIYFIDDDSRNIFELDRNIRFVNMETFNIHRIEMLYGFLCGLLSCDYDIEHIFIDGINYLSDLPEEELQNFLMVLDKLARNNEVKLLLCWSYHEDTPPEFLKERLI